MTIDREMNRVSLLKLFIWFTVLKHYPLLRTGYLAPTVQFGVN